MVDIKKYEASLSAWKRITRKNINKNTHLTLPPCKPHVKKRTSNAFKYIYDIFEILSSQRSWGVNGALPISIGDIKAIFNMKGIYIVSDIELSLLQRLDTIWITDYYEKKNK